MQELVEVYSEIRITKEYYINLGKNINSIEIKFNESAGLTDSVNRIPDLMLKEKLSSKDVIFEADDSILDDIVRQLRN